MYLWWQHYVNSKPYAVVKNSHEQAPEELIAGASRLPPPWTTVPWETDTWSVGRQGSPKFKRPAWSEFAGMTASATMANFPRVGSPNGIPIPIATPLWDPYASMLPRHNYLFCATKFSNQLWKGLLQCTGNLARQVTRGNCRADAGGSQPLIILIWNY